MSDPQQAAPRHLDPGWRFLPLNENAKPPKGCTLNERPDYWQGVQGDWAGFGGWVERGNTVGLLPERSGLVVLDCDTRVTWGVDADGVGSQVVHHGIDDLKRVAAEHGEAVEPTFCVQTKSGGLHLYYRQNPRLRVRSHGHRDGWLIDVKASANVFVVAPPSRGYQVVRDLEAAEMPEWLAQWVNDLGRRTLPLGGERMTRLREAIKRDQPLAWSEGSVFTRWVGWVLDAIRIADAEGGWNNEIYLACRTLFDVGLTVDDVRDLVMRAAAPRSGADERMATDTITSAWRGHLDGGVPDWSVLG